MIEPRSAPRRRQLKSGLICFNQRHSALPCSVRELSATGARLRTDQAHIPDRFELIIELDGLEADCQVIWRREREMGVEFLSEPRRTQPRRVQSLQPTKPAKRAPIGRNFR